MNSQAKAHIDIEPGPPIPIPPDPSEPAPPFPDPLPQPEPEPPDCAAVILRLGELRELSPGRLSGVMGRGPARVLRRAPDAVNSR